MNYETAKQLEKAGFPQEGKLLCKKTHFHGSGIGSDCDELRYPSLSELIKECGEEFFKLVNFNGESEATWQAQGHNFKGYGQGKTPEIAVSNLYLKLKEKPKVQSR